MRIIDPHVHVWKNDPAFPWAAETTNPPAEDRTPEMLLELMDAHGIEKTVLVQVIYYRWDNSYIAHVAKQYPDRLMAVGRVNPEDPDAPDHASDWVLNHGICGVRLSPGADAAGDWFTGPLMDPLFARTQELGVPLLLLTQPSRLNDLVPLLERHGDLDVVIDHMADVHPDDAAGRKSLMALADHDHVTVKISHTWSISKQGYPWIDTHDLVSEVYQTFGPRRIMFGTDWPVCLANAEYGQTLTAVRDEMKCFSPADLEWVLGKTALTLWSFGE
ncbi:MAG: amidohydrolase [Planctomycetaceae bacterium]|nr:amidohydrolase [Planctomycetaceae bacterium]